MTARGRLDHVCLFAANLQGGGAERMMANLASGLANLGLRVDLVLGEAKGPYLADIDSHVRIVDLDRRTLGRAIPGFVRYLRRERPQIVLTTLGYTSVGAALGHAVSGIGAILFIREANTPSQLRVRTPKEFVVATLMRAVYRYADGVVAVSEGVAADLRVKMGVPAAKIATLGNPVVTSDILVKAAQPLGHPWFEEPHPPIVLGVGRLHPQKDFATLVRAFGRLREKRTARLVILGDGSERAALEALVRELGLQADVDLPGFVANPFAFMSRASVFVLSSVREGLPGALIQAMATGCPVVATHCPSGPFEILEGGRHGKLVPVGAVEDMAHAIASTLDRPPNREDVRRGSERFSSDRVVRSYYEFFERALDATMASATAKLD
jgi:glycosyltransferase involved in cell wall biosynthesis